MVRSDGRELDQIRNTKIQNDVQAFAEGSALITTGDTQVLCAVSIEEGVPRFLKGTGQGWITAEYSMLPRSTSTRTRREISKPKGRTQEIQRLIGRSLRASVDLSRVGERTLIIDCDVLQADGGTRTAAITGSYVALYHALNSLIENGKLDEMPLNWSIAATSVGLLDGEVLLDLDYSEDSRAEVDFNVVMTSQGEIIELQGTAEQGSFSRQVLNEILDKAELGINSLLDIQAKAISDFS